MFLNIIFFIAKERLKIINNLYKPNIEKVDMPFYLLTLLALEKLIE